MKYIMMQTTDRRMAAGQKMAILFPDSLVHETVAAVMSEAIKADTGSAQRVKCVSAGFVSLPNGVQVHGASDTLGLSHNPIDAARINADGAVSFMPDEMLASVAGVLSQIRESGSRFTGKYNKLIEAAEAVEQWWSTYDSFATPEVVVALRTAIKDLKE